MKSDALPESVAQSFATATGLPWQVEPLFRGAVDDDLKHYLVATVNGVSPRDLEVNPFDLADRLVAASPRDIATAEPDLPQNVYEPGHDPTSPLRLRGARSSGGDDGPAPPQLDWHLRLTRVLDAWNLPPAPGGTALGAGIRIGHPDTGYTRHASFPAPTLDTGTDYDFVKDDDDAFDPMDYRGNKGHGTKTASVILGRGITHGGQAVKGVAPAATLVPIRTIKSVVVVWNGDVARAIKHAIDQGCHVISMSLGGLGTGAIEAAVNLAVERDLIVLAAAGNQVSWVVSPANYPHCIAIAACNIHRMPWRASAHGKAVAVTAPGENVWVAKPGGHGEPQDQPVAGSGTSYAVATVAGAAALWLAHHGRDNLLARYAGRRKLQDVFRELLRTTAVPGPGWDPRNYGSGILDVAALLAAPLPGDVARLMRGPAPLRPRAAARTAEPGVRSAVERLSTLYEDASPAQVEAAVRAMVKGRSTARGAERYATELLHVLGTDPMARELFREFLDQPAVKPAMRRSAVRSPAVANLRPDGVRDVLADRMSDRLAMAML